MFHTSRYKSVISGGFDLTTSVCICRLMASGRGSVLGAVETTRILTNTTPSIRWTWSVPDRCSSNSEDPGQTASCNHSPHSERHLERLQQLVCVSLFCRQYSVGFEMVTVSTVGDPGSAAFQKKNSGDYRCSQNTLAVLIISVLSHLLQ